MLRVFALLFMALSLPSHAILVNHCTAERVALVTKGGERFSNYSKVELEHSMARVEFQTLEANTAIFQSATRFKMLPGIVLHNEIRERVSGGRIRHEYRAVVKTEAGQVLVANGQSGGAFLSADGRHHIGMLCMPFESTGDLTPPPPPDGVREKLRRTVFTPGLLREYYRPEAGRSESTIHNILEAYDLFRQLLLHAAGNEELVRLVNANVEKGFEPILYSALYEHVDQHVTVVTRPRHRGKCDSGGLRFICDIEEVRLSFEFAGPGAWSNEEGFPTVEVTGRIFRDSDTRLIRGYRVIEAAAGRGGPHGGGSTTSGGFTRPY